jgi:hypothetical protein
MKFSELTEEDIAYIAEIYLNKELLWDARLRALSDKFNRSERTIQNWITKLGLSTKSLEESPQLAAAKAREFNRNSKRFIITWAQNATEVHQEFWNNLKEYADFLGADIHVIAGRYKNPTSIFSASQRFEEWWASDVVPYLDANRHNVHKYVSIMSDLKIQPTAVNPMTGLQGLSGINSCVFGSPKVQLETIPVLEGNKPKMMVTTGACTVHNYTDSKAGKKGEFHHTLGFVIIEIKDDETFFLRQVTATDDGNFTDLFYNVSTKDGKSNIERIKSVAAIVWGDLHYGKHDLQVFDSTFELMSKVNPEWVVLHDVFDGDSINHHEIKDPFVQYQKELTNSNSLKKEIDELLEGLAEFQDYNVVIVRSNHDDFVDRWLKDTDWRKTVTLKNSLEYMQFAAAILSQDAPNGIIPFLINKKFPHFKTLSRSDSFIIKDWELAHHGDIGSSGSRGSLRQFRTLNSKVIVGHYHSPGRMDGALAVGTSTKLRVGYNIGASSWLQSHVLIHHDGKAQHIHFIDGEYTTLK